MPSPPGPQDNVFLGPLSLAEATGLTAAFQGDVTVTHRLSGCHLQVGGRLDAGNATITGGSIQVDGDATVGALGSQDATPTRMTLCPTAGPSQQLAAALNVLTEEKAAIQTMQKRIAMLEEDASQFNHSEREEMTLAMFDMPDHESAIERLEQLTTLVEQRFGTGGESGPSLHISKVLHAGVTIAIDGTDAQWTCETELHGPVRIQLNKDGAMIAESESGDIRKLDANAGDAQ